MTDITNFVIDFKITSEVSSSEVTSSLDLTTVSTVMSTVGKIQTLFKEMLDLTVSEKSIQASSFNFTSLTTYCEKISTNIQTLYSTYESQSTCLDEVGKFDLNETMTYTKDNVTNIISLLSEEENSENVITNLTSVYVYVKKGSKSTDKIMFSNNKNKTPVSKGRTPTSTSTVSKTKKVPLNELNEQLDIIINTLRTLGNNDSNIASGISLISSALTGKIPKDSYTTDLMSTLQVQLSNLQNQLMTSPPSSRASITTQIATIQAEITRLSRSSGSKTTKSTSSLQPSASRTDAQMNSILAAGGNAQQSLTGKVSSTSGDSSITFPTSTTSKRGKRGKKANKTDSETNKNIDSAIANLNSYLNNLSLEYQTKVNSGTVTTQDSTSYFTSVSNIQSQIETLRESKTKSSRHRSSGSTNILFRPFRWFQRTGNNTTNAVENVVNTVADTIYGNGILGMGSTYDKDRLYDSLNAISIQELSVPDETTTYTGYSPYLRIYTLPSGESLPRSINFSVSGILDEEKFSYNSSIDVSMLEYLGNYFLTKYNTLDSDSKKEFANNYNITYIGTPTLETSWNLFLISIFTIIGKALFVMNKFSAESGLYDFDISPSEMLSPDNLNLLTESIIPSYTSDYSDHDSAILSEGMDVSALYYSYGDDLSSKLSLMDLSINRDNQKTV